MLKKLYKRYIIALNYGERSDFMPKNDNKNGFSAFLSLFNGTKPLSGEAKRGLICFIVLIFTLIFTVCATAMQSRTAGSVEGLKASTAGDTSVSLTWDKTKASKGYCVYASKDGKKYNLAATVSGKKNTSVKVEKLAQGTKYSFYVTAFNAKERQGEKSAVVSAYTAPQTVTLSSVISNDKGVLTAEWSECPKASGYELQYAEGAKGDFSKAKSVDASGKSTTAKIVEKLKENTDYSVRVRAYIKDGQTLVNGAWSAVKTVKISDTLVINKSKPMIALTFDDGPGYNDASDRILDVLEKYNARATFFMVGKNAADHPNNVKRKIKLKCELGNHTYNHNHYGKNVTANDIKDASDAIYKACGQYPTAFRSPGGNTTDTIRNECKKENMALYYWSVDTEDWKSRNADKVYNAVMKNVKDGDIILMHEIYSSTADAVERMVPELIKKGYQLVTCEELIQAKTGAKPKSGEQYVDAKTINNKTS